MNFCSLCPDKTTYLDIPYIKLKLWTSVIHWYTAFKNLRNYGRDGWLYDSLAPPLVYLLHSILQMDLITLFWRPIAFKQAQGFDGKMNYLPTAWQDVCRPHRDPLCLENWKIWKIKTLHPQTSTASLQTSQLLPIANISQNMVSFWTLDAYKHKLIAFNHQIQPLSVPWRRLVRELP